MSGEEWTGWYEKMLKFIISKCDKCVALAGTHHEKLVNQEYVLDEEINRIIEDRNGIVHSLAQKYYLGWVDLYTYFKSRREIYPHRDHCHFFRNADRVMAKRILCELNYGDYNNINMEIDGGKEMKASSVIATVLGAAAGVAVGATVMKKSKEEVLVKRKEMSDKHFELFQLMNQWLINKQQGKEIASYLEKLNYKKIAIYGMSYAGERLYDDLKDTDIEVAYAIDKRAEKIYTALEMYTIEDELPEVDAIVVTAITFYDEIEQALMEVSDIQVVSLEDIIYGL